MLTKAFRGGKTTLLHWYPSLSFQMVLILEPAFSSLATFSTSTIGIVSSPGTTRRSTLQCRELILGRLEFLTILPHHAITLHIQPVRERGSNVSVHTAGHDGIAPNTLGSVKCSSILR